MVTPSAAIVNLSLSISANGPGSHIANNATRKPVAANTHAQISILIFTLPRRAAPHAPRRIVIPAKAGTYPLQSLPHRREPTPGTVIPA